ncbi:MAG: lamin tail domain-containing protein [bacterium]|nr:lamin tail domain-containing protein [bacterium]
MRNLSRAVAILFLLFLSVPSQATNSLNVVINEIAWMGTTNSANDEWVELYNNTDNSINLDGWQLITQDGTPKITLSGIIPANGFYLLERTDDETVPGISADLIYKGALGNNGENLKLYDSSGNLIIDEVNCQDGWPAGDNDTKQTMERPTTGWQTSENPGGTPKSKNSAGAVVKTEPTPTENNKQKTEIIPTETIVYPSGIILNEILPSPEGADETEEWIEVLNQNNFEVLLSDWKITDTVGKITTYSFPKGIKIPPQGFLVFSRPTTKITLNNDGDGLKLIQPDGKIVDEATYEKAPRGQSYNLINSNWSWSTNLTPGAVNFIPFPQPEEKIGAESLKDKSITEPETKRELATIGEQISKSSRSLFILLIALSLAIFSGTTILFLKKKLTSRVDL